MFKQTPILNEKFMGIQLKPVVREKVQPQNADRKDASAFAKVFLF